MSDPCEEGRVLDSHQPSSMFNILVSITTGISCSLVNKLVVLSVVLLYDNYMAFLICVV